MDGLPEYRAFYLRAFFVSLVLVSLIVFSGCGGSSSSLAPDFSSQKPEQLLSYTATGTPAERLEACRCLASHTDSTLAFNELLTLTGDSDKMVQLAAIAGLGQSGSNEAVKKLLPFLGSKDLLLSYNTMNALVTIGNKSAVYGVFAACQKDAELAAEFQSLLNDSKVATGLADGLIALASDGSANSLFRLNALKSLKTADCNREQIKLLFKVGKSEKNKEVAGEFLRCGKAMKKAFIQRKEAASLPSDRGNLQDSLQPSTDKNDVLATNSSDQDLKEIEEQKRAAALNAEEMAKRTRALKAQEAAKRARALKAKEAAKRARALKTEEAARRTRALKAAEAAKRAQAVQLSFGWIEPSDALSDFVSEASRHMKDGGDRNRAVRFYNQGVEAGASGDFRTAIEAYSNAVRELPAFGEAHYALAILYDRQRNYSKGLFHLSQFILIDPDKSDVYYRIGCNYENQGKAKMAHAFFILAGDKDPSNGEYTFRAGLIAFRKEDLHGAVALMKQALNAAPSRGDIAQNLAALYLNLGQYQVARKYALKARSLGADVSAVMGAIDSSSP